MTGEAAVIGAAAQIGGFALAGVRVYPVETPEEARAAWSALPATVVFAIVTPAVAAAVHPQPDTPLTVVLPA